MKPIKTLLPFSRWLLRILMLGWLLMHNIQVVQGMDVHNQPFYIALGFILFGALLFAGGFSSKPGLTVISAIFLTLLFIYKIYLSFVPQVTEGQLISFVFLSIAIYFMSSANK
ncbi:MAG TPA: hypothetical protein VK172_14490 [Lentimicrobium sp.]|nr:hypothetical protein [Lentimicrobium sp.]